MGRKVGLDFSGTESRTKQSFRDGTKVDQILKQYATRGVNPNDVGLFQSHVIGNMNFGVQPDTDYQQQLNRVIEMKQKFLRLPATVRDKFLNDPARMISWLANPKNIPDAIKLGLLSDDPKPTPEPTPTPTPAPTPTPPPK